MALPHPKTDFTPPALTDEEEAELIRKAMEGDWQEDADALDDPAFADDDEDELEDEDEAGPIVASDAKPKARGRRRK